MPRFPMMQKKPYNIVPPSLSPLLQVKPLRNVNAKAGEPLNQRMCYRQWKNWDCECNFLKTIFRNNRKINGGNDLPRDFLSELYHSIFYFSEVFACVPSSNSSPNSVSRMVPDQGVGVAALSRSHWIGLIHKAKQTSPFIVSDSGSHLDYDMFAILSGPAIAAISVVFDHAEQEEVLQSCIDGFLAIAKLSASEKSILYFADDMKAKMATVAVFTIANRYGDHIRSGWRNVLDCILSLKKIGLLPSRLASDATDDVESSSDRDLVKTLSTNSPASQVPATTPAWKSSGIMGRFSLLLSRDLAARQRTLQTIQNCHIDSIFADSKFLQAESLSQLVRARNNSLEDEDTSVFCLELLIAVFGLLRICQRLLPYKENLTDELLKSLQLVLKEVMHLVKANAMQFRSHMGWRTIISLLSITARHPEASEAEFETLSYIMSEGGHLSPANYVLCLNAARQFAESRVGFVDRSVKSLDLMAGSILCLVRRFYQTKEAAGEEAAIKMSQDIVEMWMRLVQGLRKVCLDQREEVRNHAILLLQRRLTGVEGIHIPTEMWLQCFDQVIFTLLEELLELAQQNSPKDYRSVEGSFVLSLKLLSKAFLQSLLDISQSSLFCQVWLKVLSCMEGYMKMRFKGKKSEKIHELTSGILVPSDPIGGDSFWQITWLHVNNIAPSLQLKVFSSEELEKMQEKNAKARCSPLPDGSVLVPPNETTA
ncbi:hypothetical protein ACJIZ3_010543 [Penstemon smallii]|uniref:GBF1-like tetratricopeptide repeats domain-containing protein n=1 Tax=Penstemon smallii TaxID=265156 RepID=A0ABD3UGL6_9LAMI